MPSQISIHALLAESDARRDSRQQPAGISIHALLAESDTPRVLRHCTTYLFLSTLSLRRATGCGQYCIRARAISIHALLAESDAVQIVVVIVHALFLSTLSLRRATSNFTQKRHPPLTISIHALLAESDARRDSRQQPAGISIHALLAESDSAPRFTPTASRNFYPRSPCGERQPTQTKPTEVHTIFLSTLSLRRATYMGVTVLGIQHNFYPRSPCGERRAAMPVSVPPLRFLSTLSLRRATRLTYRRTRHSPDISIHALLAESDGLTAPANVEHQKFLSTLSLRRATIKYPSVTPHKKFLSTLSLRRATQLQILHVHLAKISIHALLAESDHQVCQSPRCGWLISIHALLAESDDVACGDRHKLRNFYPRSPCGERRAECGHVVFGHQISIHALLAESDIEVMEIGVRAPIFLSTLSLRRATQNWRKPHGQKTFLSTLSLRRATYDPRKR